MALSDVHQNIISEEMTLAEDLLKLVERMKALRIRFDLNNTYKVVEAKDGQEVDLKTIFPHLDQSKVGNGFNTFDAIITALGDPENGNAAALYLLKG